MYNISNLTVIFFSVFRAERILIRTKWVVYQDYGHKAFYKALFNFKDHKINSGKCEKGYLTLNTKYFMKALICHTVQTDHSLMLSLLIGMGSLFGRSHSSL